MKPIYKPKGRAGEYGDLALNIYTGCNHGCAYCYAPRILRKQREEFDKVEPRAGIVEATRKQIEQEEIKDQLIHLCFTCDPYPADVDSSVTRKIIEIIKKSGNHVQILTKGGMRAVRDFDLLDENDWFGVSITGKNDWVSKFEPKAESHICRLFALHEAYERKINTWVSMEPVVSPKLVYEIIENEEYIDLFKIGKLNYLPSPINWSEFGQECERLCKSHHRNYYIKEDLRELMEKQNA